MKNTWIKCALALGGLVLSFGSDIALARELGGKPKVSVVKFVNKSALDDTECKGWNWFATDLGSAFQERLISALLKSGKVEVLERETIREIYENEHNLVNSRATKPLKKGQFERASYVFAGAVSDFQWCAEGGGGGLNVGRLLGFGDLDVSTNSSSSSVAVNVRLLDATTGQVLKTASSRAEKSMTRYGLSGEIRSVDFRSSAFTSSPLGQAIEEAVNAATEELLAAI